MRTTVSGAMPQSVSPVRGRSEATVRLDLPHEITAPATARHAVQATLAQWPDASETAAIVVSELVTNAVQHADPPVSLDVKKRCGYLHIRVTDGGTRAPQWREADADDEGGRGLPLVAALADSYGYRFHPLGKTVWAVIASP